VEETTRQFKKLESDVQRVEMILEEKEYALQEARQSNEQLKEEVDKVVEEKKILIEAIFEKDLVIKEYEAKLKELLGAQVHFRIAKGPSEVESEETSTQTDSPAETCPKASLTAIQQHNL
jgi:hypothetical protein